MRTYQRLMAAANAVLLVAAYIANRKAARS